MRGFPKTVIAILLLSLMFCILARTIIETTFARNSYESLATLTALAITLSPTYTPEPDNTLEPTHTPNPTYTPNPKYNLEETYTPDPKYNLEETYTPEPDNTLEPTHTPNPTYTSEPRRVQRVIKVSRVQSRESTPIACEVNGHKCTNDAHRSWATATAYAYVEVPTETLVPPTPVVIYQQAPPVPTYTPYPTSTPMPTYTPYPTSTPMPTYTPKPTRLPEVVVAPEVESEENTPVAVPIAGGAAGAYLLNKILDRKKEKESGS